MSKGTIRRWGGGCNSVFPPRTFLSDGIVDGVISGSSLMLKIRWGGGGMGRSGESLLTDRRLSTQGNVVLLLTHHESGISRQSFQLNQFDPVSSWREDSFDTGQFTLLFPSTHFHCSLEEALTRNWGWSLVLFWFAVTRGTKLRREVNLKIDSFWSPSNAFHL